jgi:hypothetical protein
MPRTVADAARMTRIQRLSCTSGHWYRRRVSRYITSVAISRARGRECRCLRWEDKKLARPADSALEGARDFGLLARLAVFEKGCIYMWRGVDRDLDESVLFRRFGFVNWAAMLLRKASNRMVQRVLLDVLLTLRALCWIQRWAALLPKLVADFDQSHLATKLKAKLRLADGPGPETRLCASERGTKSSGQ